MRLFVLALALSPLLMGPAISGAWTLPEGSGQAIVSLQYSSATDQFDENGDLVAIEPFEKYEMRGYFEYGLTDQVTLVLQPEFRRKEQGGERSQGLGRVDLGGRVRVWSGDAGVAALGASVSVPGQTDDLVPLNGGDTEWEVEGRLLYGIGFDIGARNGFLDAQAGYRHRFGDPADEVVLDLTLGLDITPGYLGIIQSFNTLSVGKAQEPFSETRDHKLAFSTVYRLGGGLSVQAGGIATVYGRDVLRERGMFISVWQSF